MKILDITAIDDVGRLAGAGRLQDGQVHGFVMTLDFPDRRSRQLRFSFRGSRRKIRSGAWRSGPSAGLALHRERDELLPNESTAKTLTVASGTHFTPAQRAAAQDALAAALEGGECRNALPIAPTTVPYVFSRKNERVQFSVRLVRKHRISVFVESPPQANVVALNVPKKKVKGTVRITLVARKLLDGGATPATVSVR